MVLYSGATRAMNDSADRQAAFLEARDNRRWLIGVCISVAFGLFGVVMALLSYSRRTPPAPAAGSTPAAHGPAANTPPRAPVAEASDASGTRDRRQRRREK